MDFSRIVPMCGTSGLTPDKSEYITEVVKIQNEILRHYKPDAFCHNDLHNKNLKKSKKKIFLIDFDHANYGFRGYDLAYYLLHCGHSQTKRFIQDDKYPDFAALLKVKMTEIRVKHIICYI